MSELVRGLSITYASGSRLPGHRHSWSQLVYATAGVMTVGSSQGSWVVPSQRAVWIPAETDHWLETSGRVSMRTLYLAPPIREGLPTACRVVSVHPLLRELILHTLEICPLDASRARHRRLRAFLLDQIEALRVEPLQLPMPSDPRAARVADFLRRNPAEPATLDRLAETAAASPRTLERLFRRETQLTFGQWRLRLRLLEGLRLLAAGEAVTEVALAVGYDSPSAFIHQFKKTLGTTPGRYYQPARGPMQENPGAGSA